jgi:hypothetical protein
MLKVHHLCDLSSADLMRVGRNFCQICSGTTREATGLPIVEKNLTIIADL